MNKHIGNRKEIKPVAQPLDAVPAEVKFSRKVLGLSMRQLIRWTTRHNHRISNLKHRFSRGQIPVFMRPAFLAIQQSLESQRRTLACEITNRIPAEKAI